MLTTDDVMKLAEILAGNAKPAEAVTQSVGLRLNTMTVVAILCFAVSTTVQATLLYVGMKDRITPEFARAWAKEFREANPTIRVPDVDSIERSLRRDK